MAIPVQIQFASCEALLLVSQQSCLTPAGPALLSPASTARCDGLISLFMNKLNIGKMAGIISLSASGVPWPAVRRA